MLDDVRAALSARLGPTGTTWLAEACDRVRERAQAVGALFPAVGRRCGRGPRDAHERRGVLRALPVLDSAGLGDRALPVVRDALRTNDTRLVAAALGPYAARHLEPEAWRQGVLKCAFVGVPLAEVAGLAERADAELARMFGDYAKEREAAGRPVSEDVRLVAERKEA